MGGGSDNNLGRLSPVQNLSLGMMAGVCAKSCNYPFLVWKNTAQQGLKMSMDPFVVYRGLPMACLNLGGTTAVQFWATGFFQNLISKNNTKVLNKTETMGAAALGGFVSGVPCSVWELTMIQQQRFGGTLLGAPMKVVSEQGVSTLLRGVAPCCGRESIFTLGERPPPPPSPSPLKCIALRSCPLLTRLSLVCTFNFLRLRLRLHSFFCACGSLRLSTSAATPGMLGICPVLQQILMEDYAVQQETALAVGALTAAFISATATHPLDTIKTCMQVGEV
jgi:hypothetical protein